MKRGARKTFLIDVAEPAHRAGITNAQEVEIFRIRSVGRKHRNRIETRAVVMQLPFGGASRRRAVKEIPEAAGAAVVAPIRNGWHITQHRIESDLRFLDVTEIRGDPVDLLLA